MAQLRGKDADELIEDDDCPVEILVEKLKDIATPLSGLLEQIRSQGPRDRDRYHSKKWSV